MSSLKSDNPISLQFDLLTGTFVNSSPVIERRLTEMGKMFHDQEAVANIFEIENRLIYDMTHYYFETSTSDMSLAVSRIQPGKIADEYHMTKGHFHERSDQPEIYFCLQGDGFLLMETKEGEFKAEAWSPGTITHIPSNWAHRVVNTGHNVLFFISTFHKSAGHVYEDIEKQGFKNIVIEKDGEAILIPNPNRQEIN